MQTVTDIDREAAAALREAIAELSGFWIRPGDDNALCQALARHRSEAEARLGEKRAAYMSKPPHPLAVGEAGRNPSQRVGQHRALSEPIGSVLTARF
jgi:hypothetical protein